MGELKDGLYHLVTIAVSPTLLNQHFSTILPTNPFVYSTSTASIFNLWHCRMGHTPITRLNVISNPSIKDHLSNISTDQPCFVCPIAKHHRLPFPTSSHKSKQIFDLIH